MELKKIKDIFNFEKGSLQSTKCTPGEYDFITASSDWKTHKSFDNDCEALVVAVAASGSLGRVHYVNGKFISSDLCFILTPKDSAKFPVDLKFYYSIFKSIKEDLVKRTATGTAKQSINKTNFGNYKIPYYSINQQQKLGPKFDKLSKNKEILQDKNQLQEDALAKLEQLVIQKAIEGKLTIGWRNDNNINIETAEKLFKKEKKEYTSLPIKKEDTAYRLPINWIWCRLGSTLEFNYGSGLDQSDRKEDGKYFAYGANGPKTRTDRYNCESDGLIIGRKGSAGAVNKVEGPFYATDVTYYVSKKETKIFDLDFLEILLISLRLPLMAKGVKPGLNRNEVYNRIIGLPPKKEQEEIVLKIKVFKEKFMQLKQELDKNRVDFETLSLSFLKEAFVE